LFIILSAYSAFVHNPSHNHYRGAQMMDQTRLFIVNVGMMGIMMMLIGYETEKEVKLTPKKEASK
jgi:hypothetical protein